MKKQDIIRVFLYCWLFAAAVVFVMQFFFSGLIANASLWNGSIGWQREIALWNLGMIFAIVYALRINDLRTIQYLTLVLVIISFILGINHLLTLIFNRATALTHLFGVIFNFLAVISGFYVLNITRR